MTCVNTDDILSLGTYNDFLYYESCPPILYLVSLVCKLDHLSKPVGQKGLMFGKARSNTTSSYNASMSKVTQLLNILNVV